MPHPPDTAAPLPPWRWVMAAVLALVVAPLNLWALRGEPQRAAPRRPDEAEAATLHQAIRTGAFWLLTLTFTCYSFAQSAFWAHVMPAFADKGYDATEALHVLVWVCPCQVGGRVLYVLLGRHWPLRRGGLIPEYFGRAHIGRIGGVISTAGLLALALARKPF